VGELDRRYQQRVRLPLLCHDCFPDDVSVQSGPRGLEFQAVVAAPPELAGPSSMPEVVSGDLAQLICHESVCNNIVRAALGGRTRSLTTVLNSILLAESVPASANQTLSLTLARSEPLRVRFASGEMQIELSGTRYAYDYQGESFGIADEIGIAFGYRVEQAGDGWQFVLCDKPEVRLPAAGLRGVARRRVLANILARDLPAQIDIQQLTLPISQELSIPLVPEFVRFEDGWLLLGMRVASN
jgi:hypothetical protein